MEGRYDFYRGEGCLARRERGVLEGGVERTHGGLRAGMRGDAALDAGVGAEDGDAEGGPVEGAGWGEGLEVEEWVGYYDVVELWGLLAGLMGCWDREGRRGEGLFGALWDMIRFFALAHD